MSTKTTPTDIRYEYMHIERTNIFLNLFTRTIGEDLDMNFEYLARGNR